MADKTAAYPRGRRIPVNTGSAKSTIIRGPAFPWAAGQGIITITDTLTLGMPIPGIMCSPITIMSHNGVVFA